MARLWIADDIPFNSETWLIAQSVKRIKRERPDVQYLVSYADPSAGHEGTIYKAANWIPDGMTDDERLTPRFDYEDANSGKRFSRRSHVPDGTAIKRVPRTSKHRFYIKLRASVGKRPVAQMDLFER